MHLSGFCLIKQKHSPSAWNQSRQTTQPISIEERKESSEGEVPLQIHPLAVSGVI